MTRSIGGLVVLLGFVLVCVPGPGRSACCYFSAKDKDVLQPAQKAFITWDPDEKVETFTVQPRFEGNAADFGMVIPTPSQPKLHEMPRDFFKELAVFTILEPMDLSKYKPRPMFAMSGMGANSTRRDASHVKVLEAGIVGSLDYKVIQADKAYDLYAWLKEHGYNYSGDEASLDHYIKKGWYFTVMKIDPAQMRRNPDGTYQGDVTPTRFNFVSDQLVYPLRITQISVREKTEALLYVQAPHKMDLAGDFSFEYTWQPMWSQATGFVIPEKLTKQESAWQEYVRPHLEELQTKAQQQGRDGRQPATLEWAKRIGRADLDVLEGHKPYNRQAPREDVANLKLLRGHMRQGQFVTKIRKAFTKGEMNRDLEFVRARVGERADDLEYFAILPTSPP